jgi:hypothetical protein
MERIPLEVLVRHASQKVGDYLAKQVEEERRRSRVAILVEDFTNSFYFMDCDEYGYPKFHQFNYMTFDSLALMAIQNVGETPNASTMTVEEVSIYIESPMLTQRYDWEERPVVFLWRGRKMSSRKIPLEQLNVSELQKLAQQAIKNREGLVIDEAFKNKIYK